MIRKLARVTIVLALTVTGIGLAAQPATAQDGWIVDHPDPDGELLIDSGTFEVVFAETGATVTCELVTGAVQADSGLIRQHDSFAFIRDATTRECRGPNDATFFGVLFQWQLLQRSYDEATDRITDGVVGPLPQFFLTSEDCDYNLLDDPVTPLGMTYDNVTSTFTASSASFEVIDVSGEGCADRGFASTGDTATVNVSLHFSPAVTVRPA